MKRLGSLARYALPLGVLCLFCFASADADLPMQCELHADEHGGGLNKCGCHFDRKANTCHCHQAYGCGCSCQPASCSK